MEPLGVFTVLGLALAGSGVARIWRQQKLSKILRTEWDFRPERDSFFCSKWIGDVQGLRVAIDFSHGGAKERFGLFRSVKKLIVVVEVWDPQGSIRYLSLFPGQSTGNRIPTGDSGFDDVVSALGKEPTVRSRLSADARALLKDVISPTCYMDTGRVFLASSPLLKSDLYGVLKADISSALNVYRCVFESQKSVDLRLARVALGDPIGEVRFRALHLLIEHSEDPLISRTAAWDALSDVNHDCVILAASHLASNSGNTDEEWAKLKAAVVRCESHWNDWPSWRNASLVLLARTLARIETPARQDSLIRMLKLDDTEQGLGPDTESDSTGAVDILIRSKSRHVALAAIDALEIVGEVVAVEYLKPLAKGNFLDSRVSRAAHRAIKSIQARVSGAGVGQLSFSSDDDGGELTLFAASRGGELGFSDPGNSDESPD